MVSAHTSKIVSATASPPAIEIPVSQIAAVGPSLDDFDDQEKVRRMRKRIRNGEPLPPVRITPLTEELREKYDVTDPKKKFWLDAGHHRLAATKLEGKKTILSKSFRDGRKI